MATKKDDTLDKLLESGAIVVGTDDSLIIHKVSTGLPPLDGALGGGYAFGRNVLCVGPESSGKTAIAQYAVASIQRTGKHALLVDTEMSFDRDWWAASGVDLNTLFVCQPPTGEDAVNIILAMLKSDPELGIIVLDSIATMSPAAIQAKAPGERTIASLAVLVTEMYQRMMPLNKHAVFFAINQLRDNMNGYEDVYPGGRALKHNSHTILRTRREEWLKEKEVRVGFVMEILIKKNKLGQPQAIVQLPFRFAGQVDMVTSYIDEAVERGIIQPRGPYYSWNGIQWLGKGNMRAHFIEQPEALEMLKQAVGA